MKASIKDHINHNIWLILNTYEIINEEIKFTEEETVELFEA